MSDTRSTSSFRSSRAGVFGQVTGSVSSSRLVAGSFGSGTNSVVVAVNENGLVTNASEVPWASSSGFVRWSLSGPLVVTANTPFAMDVVDADSTNIIDEAVAGNTMTVTNSGVFMIVMHASFVAGGEVVLVVAGVPLSPRELPADSDITYIEQVSMSAGQTIQWQYNQNTTANGTTRSGIAVIRVG